MILFAHRRANRWASYVCATPRLKHSSTGSTKPYPLNDQRYLN